MPVPDEPAEELSEEALAQLNEGLKVCQKVVSGYRAVLSGKASSTQSIELDQPDAPEEHD